MNLSDLVLTANTGADAIKRAPIVDENTGIKCLRIGDVSQKRSFSEWGNTKTTEADYQRYKLEIDDLIIARTGNTIGVNTFIDTDVNSVYNNGLIRIKADTSKVIPRYLWYLISSNDCQNFVQSIAYGTSTQPNMKINDFLRYSFEYQSLDVQRIIIEIIDPIDKKIKTNEAINRNLTEQADAIYKERFVTNPEEDWIDGHLSDLITIKYGKDHKKLEDGSIPCYGSGGVMRYVDEALYDQESVLIPRKGSLHNVIYVNAPFWSVDTMFFSMMKIPNVAKFVFHFVKGKDLSSMNAGSAVPSMTTNILYALELKIPSLDALEQFEADIKPLYLAIQNNNIENEKLANLRDSLLPKLMSGELDFSVLNI